MDTEKTQQSRDGGEGWPAKAHCLHVATHPTTYEVGTILKARSTCYLYVYISEDTYASALRHSFHRRFPSTAPKCETSSNCYMGFMYHICLAIVCLLQQRARRSSPITDGTSAHERI